MTTVAREEFTDVWIRGWGLWILLGMAVTLSSVAIGLAYTSQINLLDAREGLAILVRISLGVGLLLAAFAAADAISGERDRSTLECILLTPTPPRSLVAGKLVVAFVWWLAAFVVSLPYLWAMGVGLGGSAALVVAGIIGALLAVTLTAVAGTASILSRSNLHAFGFVFLITGVLAVPGLLPAAMMRGSIGSAVLRIDPVAAAQHVINTVIVDQQPLADVVTWMISPVVGAVVAVAVVARAARRIALEPRS